MRKPKEIDKINPLSKPVSKEILKTETKPLSIIESKDDYLKRLASEKQGDTEFLSDVMPKFISPIGILGMNPKYFRAKFEDDFESSRGKYGGITLGFYKPDSLKGDRTMTVKDFANVTGDPDLIKEWKLVADNPSIEHEAIHRGMDLIREYYRKEDIAKRFGEDTANFIYLFDVLQPKIENKITGKLEGGEGNFHSEIITEINDARRLGMDDAQSLMDRFFYKQQGDIIFTESGKVLKAGSQEQKEYMLGEVLKVLDILPNIEQLAKERLYDRNLEGGPTEDARGLPKGSLEEQIYGGKKDFYKPYKKEEEGKVSKFFNNLKTNLRKLVTRQPNFEKASKQMPKEFNKGGDTPKQVENKFDPEGDGYDFKTAKEYGIKPDKNGHYQSRVPETGMILKGRKHPTFDKTIEADKKLGYQIVKGTDGRYYSFKKSLAMAEGGATMEQQMELFGEQGGLKDDGMDRDPISGNEVPSGSLAEEVRDDIPAQLSEGEYVVPADVVRFFGIKFFEDLRMQAKIGLNQMERSGRIGGEPIAVEIETSEETLDPKDEEKIRGMLQGFNEGAFVEDKDFEKDATKKTFDPKKYSIPGFSYIRDKKDDGPTNDEILSGTKDGEIIYYHPDGQERKVKYVDGEIVNEDDVKFTQPPWSLTKPKASEDTDVSETSPTLGVGDRGDDSDRESRNYYGQSLTSNFEDVAPAKAVSTEALAREYGGEALYYDENFNNPIKMTDAAYQGLVSDYERLELAELGVSFKDWYNTPTTTKISMSFNKLMGYEPSKADIDLALKNAKKQPSLFSSGILGYIRSFIYDRTEAKEARGLKDLEKLPVPTKSPLEKLYEGDASAFLSGKDKKGKPIMTKGDVEKYYEAIGQGTLLGTRKADKFLLGLREDGTVFKGKRDKKTKQPIYEKADAETLSRLEQNRQDVQQRTEAAYSDPSLSLRERERMIHGFDVYGGNTPNVGSAGQDNIGGVSSAAPDITAEIMANKGGLASKPKAKAKQKRNTKGLGTKPKAT